MNISTMQKVWRTLKKKLMNESMEKLPKEFKDKWVAALRSGDYKQAHGELYNKGENSFCCLGVAGCVAGLKPDTMALLGYFDSTTAPDGYPAALLYAADTKVNLLMTMNDDGKSFAQIADYIEENL